MAPKDQVILVFLGVAIAAAVSFFVSLPILKATEAKGGKSLEDAQSQMAGMKAEAKGTAAAASAARSDRDCACT